MLLATPFPTAHCFAQLLCSSWGLQCQFPALGISSQPSQASTQVAPGAGALAPQLHPPTEAISISLAEQDSTARGWGWPYQAVKFHWNQGDSSVERKACRRAVRTAILRTTHEWKKENGNLFNEPVCFVI